MNSKTKLHIEMAIAAVYGIIDLILLIVYASYEINNDVVLNTYTNSATKETVTDDNYNGSVIVAGMVLNLVFCATFLQAGIRLNKYTKSGTGRWGSKIPTEEEDCLHKLFAIVMILTIIASTILSIVAFGINCTYATCYTTYTALYPIFLFNTHLFFLGSGIIGVWIATIIVSFLILLCVPTTDGMFKNMGKIFSYSVDILSELYGIIELDSNSIAEINNLPKKEIIPDPTVTLQKSPTSTITAPNTSENTATRKSNQVVLHVKPEGSSISVE